MLRYFEMKGRNGLLSTVEANTTDSLLDFIDREGRQLYENLVQRDFQGEKNLLLSVL
jgi:hypothetical protein